MDEKRKIFIKKTIFLISLAAILALLVFVTFVILDFLKELGDAESFRDYVQSFGVTGVLVGFGFQVVQVFLAIIPGEVIEIGLGFAFGSILGTLICYAGLTFASALIFLAVKKLGIKFVELFFSREKIESLSFVKKNINNPDRLRKMTFLLFVIPGTPKDLLTYFLGLTPMQLGEFLCVSLIARIPSVISSTVGGMLIHNGNYLAALILFAVTALLSITGWLGYEKHRKNKQNEQ